MGAGLFFGGRLVGRGGGAAFAMEGLCDSSSIISSSDGGAGHSGVIAKASTASVGASSAADS